MASAVSWFRTPGKKPIPHRCFVAGACLAAVVWTVAAVECAFGEDLSEAEAVRQGLEQDALRDIVEGREAVARSEATAARVWPNPSVAYAREQTSGTLGSAEDYAWVTQRLDPSGRRGLRTSAAEKRVRAASARGSARRLEVAGEIRLRFFTALYHQRRIEALERWQSEVRGVTAVVRSRQAAGDVAGYDRQRVEIEEAAAAAGLDEERAALALAQAQLVALIGADGAGDLHVTGGLLPEMPPPPLDTLLAAITTLPEVEVLVARSDAAADEIRAADRWWIPEVVLGGGLKSVEANGERSNGFTALAEIPLPLFDREQAARERAQAELRIARGELALERARATGEIRGLYRQATQLAEAARAADLAKTSSGRVAGIAAAGYRGGELGIIELLDAQRSAIEADRRAIDLAWKARAARVELDRITGGGLP